MNMTQKLYYTDAYIKEFEARVLSAEKSGELYDVVLDKTAFFPEEGGQSSDRGFIGSSRVLDVRETDGKIHHFCDTPPTIGEKTACKLDFDERFEKMQCHTAEHLLCGVIHKLFGFENTGFHLSDEQVVFDVSGVLTKEDIEKVSALANGAVYENRPVNTYFPTESELPSLEYRAKLDLKTGVRIVEIEGYDSCACCAPHARATGEIGIISILNFEKHRGGTRIYMLAGRRAERDFVKRMGVLRRISALTSEPQLTADNAVERIVGECEELRQELKAQRMSEAAMRAEMLTSTDGNLVVRIPHFGNPELIAFSNTALPKVGGILVCLGGEDGDFKYVISSRTENLRLRAGEINSALSGRGGGREGMIQGSFGATLSEIEKFFS